MRALAEPAGRATAPHRPLLARTPANVTRVRELQRTAGNRATRRLLQRQVVAPAKPQPTVTPGGDANRIEVDAPRRDALPRDPQRPRPPRDRSGPARDSTSATTTSACSCASRGARGRRAGSTSAPTRRARSRTCSTRSARTSSAGKGVDDVINTVKDAKIEPFAEVDIARSEDWKVSADVKLDVNRTGVLGGSAGVSFDKGWIRIRASGPGRAGRAGRLADRRDPARAASRRSTTARPRTSSCCGSTRASGSARAR